MIKEWWKQKRCRHLNTETTATLHHGPVLHIKAVCKDCGASVPPSVSFSENWKHDKLVSGRDLKPGESRVVFAEVTL